MPAASPLPAPALVDSVGPVPRGAGPDQTYPLVIIVGPTGAGKSALALALAGHLQGEIINCDSVQLYRGFDIGSGKVPLEDRRAIRHHLLDIVEADQVFTAGDYRRQVLPVLASVRERDKLPILVGGTGLYLRALLLGLFEGPPRSEELRARLNSMTTRRGPCFLHRLLERMDSAAAVRIHPRDTQKIIRAIEVCLLARQPLSAMLGRGRAGLQGFRLFKVGLSPNQAELHQRINQRVERMYSNGLLDEARATLARSDAARLKPLQALGYPQACAAVRGEISRDEAIRQTQAATRRYAKRQMTWFRREPGVTWFAGFGQDPEIQKRVLDWLVGAGLKIRNSKRETREPDAM